MRYLALLVLMLLTYSGIHAQNPVNVNQRIQQEKESFFNKELELSNAEAKAFWPLYKDYQNRKKRLVSEKRTLMRYYSDNSRNISDAEITEILNKYIRLEKEESALLDSYNEKFREILPDEKVLRIYISEVKFKDHLLKRLRTN